MPTAQEHETPAPPATQQDVRPTTPTAPLPDRPAGEARWYAFRVFYNRVQPLAAHCREGGIEFFAPTEVIGSLLFLRCTEDALWAFVAAHPQGIHLYRQAGSRRPATIRDHEMEVFRFVVTAGRQGLTLLGDDRPEYHLGDRVVVTGGPFKGAEGHIHRIKKDRRLVVAIPGVVAVATTYIHPSLLRRVEPTATPYAT